MKKVKLIEGSSLTELENKVNNYIDSHKLELIDFKIDQFKVNPNNMPDRLGFVGTLIYKG